MLIEQCNCALILQSSPFGIEDLELHDSNLPCPCWLAEFGISKDNVKEQAVYSVSIRVCMVLEEKPPSPSIGMTEIRGKSTTNEAVSESNPSGIWGIYDGVAYDSTLLDKSTLLHLY